MNSIQAECPHCKKLFRIELGIRLSKRKIKKLIKKVERVWRVPEAQKKYNQMKDKSTTKQICCDVCGKVVSTPVPTDTIIRAWVECPECIEKTMADKD